LTEEILTAEIDPQTPGKVAPLLKEVEETPLKDQLEAT
jgi:hypothetical protein